MIADELAAKLSNRLEFMIMQYIPKPACAEKQKAHQELVREVKEKIAARLAPQPNGITINITP